MGERFRQVPDKQQEAPKNEGLDFDITIDESEMVSPADAKRSKDDEEWAARLKTFEEQSRQSLAEENRRTSRRAFLRSAGKGLVGGTAGYALGKLGDFVYDAHQERQEKERAEAALMEYDKELSLLIIEFTKKYGDYDSRSLEEEDVVRAEFLATPEAAKMEEMAKFAGKCKNTALATKIASNLTFFNVQGLFFKAIENVGGVINCNTHSFFSLKISDIFPKDILDDHIDPRRLALQRGGSPSTVDEVKKTIEKIPGWSDAELQRKFKELARDPNIVKLGKEADLTLAEYYSLIKAVIKFKKAVSVPTDELVTLQAGAEMSDELLAKLILRERERFCETKLLSEDTENCIFFNGYDRTAGDDSGFFVGDNMEQVALAAGVPKNNIHRIDAGTDPEKNFLDVVFNLENQIVSSKGKTFILLNSHGTPEKLAVDATNKSEDSITLEYTSVAGFLVQRAIASRDPNTLSSVTLCVDSCHSYDFTKNLIDAMEGYWEVDSEVFPELKGKKLALPTIITAAQEGSFAYRESAVNWALAKQKKGIQKDGALYGARLLKKAQPETYEWNDFTVFTEVLGKYYMEIAEVAKDKDEVPV